MQTAAEVYYSLCFRGVITFFFWGQRESDEMLLLWNADGLNPVCSIIKVEAAPLFLMDLISYKISSYFPLLASSKFSFLNVHFYCS